MTRAGFAALVDEMYRGIAMRDASDRILAAYDEVASALAEARTRLTWEQERRRVIAAKFKIADGAEFIADVEERARIVAEAEARALCAPSSAPGPDEYVRGWREGIEAAARRFYDGRPGENEFSEFIAKEIRAVAAGAADTRTEGEETKP